MKRITFLASFCPCSFLVNICYTSTQCLPASLFRACLSSESTCSQMFLQILRDVESSVAARKQGPGDCDIVFLVYNRDLKQIWQKVEIF